MPFNASEVDDHSMSKAAADIEMADLDNTLNITGLSAPPSCSIQPPSAGFRTIKVNTESESEDSIHSSNEFEIKTFGENVIEKSQLKNEVYTQQYSNGNLLTHQTQEGLGRPCSIDLSSESNCLISKSSGDSNQKESENVTEDIMEVANVLASMAHQRTVDQKRPRYNDKKLISQKIPRRVSPTPLSLSQETSNLNPLLDTCGGQIQQSGQALDHIADEELPDTFADMDQSKISTCLQNAVDQGMQITSQLPAELSDSVCKERKKRSLSVSEELTRMQKRAARRALDIPNPFNLGTSTPKNFLMSFKAPLSVSSQSQPEDISKYVNALASKGSSVMMTPQETKSKWQQVDNYKRLWDMQQLDEKFNLLKADSPGQSIDSKPLASGSQSLSCVAPSKQVISQVAEQSNISSIINAYVPNIGQSLVSGKSVIIPQLTVSTTLGQTLGNANILEVLQTNEKAHQLKPPDGSVQMATPDCWQTLFAFLAGRNVHATSVANSFNPSPTSTSANVQPSHLLPTSTATRIISSGNHSPVGKTIETGKKIVDIKPRPTPLISCRQFDTDIVMIPVQTSEQLLSNVTSSSITAMHALNESKVQSTKPLSVSATPDYRPLILDSSSRPLCIKQELGSQSVRAQQSMVPNNPPGQRGGTPKSKEVVCGPNQNISFPGKRYGCDSNIQFRKEFEIKVESNSPTPYTVNLAPCHPGIHAPIADHLMPRDKPTISSSKLPKAHRRTPGDSQNEHVFFSQLGHLKIFRKEDLTFKRKLGEVICYLKSLSL